MNHFPDTRGLYAVLDRKGSFRAPASRECCAHRTHLAFGEGRKAVGFSDRVPRASLALHISHIVELSSEKEVRRLTARRIVACVADIHSVRNFSVRKKVCKSWRVPMFSSKAKLSVAATRMSRPQPFAAAAALDGRPDLLSKLDFVHTAESNRSMDTCQPLGSHTTTFLSKITAGYSH